MYDLHCHLLPGIDDGARTMHEALALARVAVADGITHMVCTPHILPGRWDNTSSSIDLATKALRAALADAGLALRLGMAAEVRFSFELLAELDAGRIPCLGEYEGERVLLLEFPHEDIPFGAERLVTRLRRMGVRPLLAHPERNAALLRDPNRIQPLLARGCLLQLTAGSITGLFGPGCRRLAERWLQDDVVFVVASDAHHVTLRPPVLSEARALVITHYGIARAMALFQRNPARLSAGLFA
jgi:protein-tyrosine phosphatase